MIRDTETMNILRYNIARFVRERLIPNEELIAETDEIPQEIVAEMKAMGLFGPTIPEEYGGLGLTMEEEVLAMFELGRASPASRSLIGTTVGIGSQGIGDGYWFVDRAVKYANERVVFDRPIGKNQGVQFPIADAYIEIEAANLMRFRACELYDANQPCGAQANMAKYLAAKASWEAANVCMQTHGGFGFANEYDIERKFRETRLYQVAPISTNLIFAFVAEHLLGLPRSF